MDSDVNQNIAKTLIPPQGYKPFWTILGSPQDKPIQTIACDIVKNGLENSELKIPMATFGDFTTIDRAEIEGYRGIKNLMMEYTNAPQMKRPLSIAVFGPPGSGKSFGVKQIAKSIASGLVEEREFNLSQFDSIDDLISCLHIVRDIVLEGKIPLVFFDEFDNDFNGKLGWLKYSPAPMQDGKFKHGELMHPVGKAIFIFAGGNRYTFEDFCANKGDREGFANAKGPDFVSRLRGYINISGNNPTGKLDGSFMIRRAMLLRNFLKRNAKDIFSGDKARIDPNVLLAMLKVPEYRHGVRSMQSIIEMSTLSGRRTFEQAALPPSGQLEMQLDSKVFSRLALYDSNLDPEKSEIIAKAIHEQYLIDSKGKDPKKFPAMKSWDNLDKEYKNSNRQFANQIPEKMYMIGCSLNEVIGVEPDVIEFRKEEIEELAKNEHERFVAERLRNGWKYGDKRSDVDKIHPLLKDWSKLNDDEKIQNRKMVIRIPKYLAKAKFEIYWLKEEEQMKYRPNPVDTSNINLDDEFEELTELLAENVHDIWAKQRMNEGWTYGTKRDDDTKKSPILFHIPNCPNQRKNMTGTQLWIH